MMDEKKFNNVRRAALRFFQRLEHHLNECLPSTTKVRERVAELKASAGTGEGWKKSSEKAFLNNYIYPGVHEFVAARPPMSAETAREALLVEGYRLKHNRKITSGSPRRSMEHPFTKVPCDAESIMAHWKKRGRRFVSGGRFADMALRGPFKTIFECKYFDGRGSEKAEAALVKGVYEAFFYLGLP